MCIQTSTCRRINHADVKSWQGDRSTDKYLAVDCIKNASPIRRAHGCPNNNRFQKRCSFLQFSSQLTYAMILLLWFPDYARDGVPATLRICRSSSGHSLGRPLWCVPHTNLTFVLICTHTWCSRWFSTRSFMPTLTWAYNVQNAVVCCEHFHCCSWQWWASLQCSERKKMESLVMENYFDLFLALTNCWVIVSLALCHYFWDFGTAPTIDHCSFTIIWSLVGIRHWVHLQFVPLFMV